MKIENLKQLDKLMLICRKRGIQSITVDNVTFHMSDLVPEMGNTVTKQGSIPTNSVFTPGGITPDTKITTDELTEEQLLMWSSRPEEYNEKM